MLVSSSPQDPLHFGTDSLVFEGVVERLGQGWATGWVWMPAEPGRRLCVEIVLGERTVAAGLAHLPRDDVAATGRGDGGYGFHIPLIVDETQTIHVRIANSGFRLPVAEKGGAGADGFVSRGAIDLAIGLTLKGWCWAPGEPGRVLSVTALSAGEPIASVRADAYRGDLASAGVGDGRHAFVLRLPFKLADGKIHSVVVQAEDGRSLMGSPIEVQALPEGPQAVLEEARGAVQNGRPEQAYQSLKLLGAYLDQVEELMPQSLSWRDYQRWRPSHAQPAKPAPAIAAGSMTLLADPPGTVALLDAGATLLPGALARACAAFAASGADMLYGDAETETALGLMPWFRPDWSYDLFLAQDYLRGLVLIRIELLKRLPPSATLADAKMLAAETARPGAIRHLPEVLTRLTEPAGDSRDWLTAIGAHVARRAPGARVEALASGDRRVHWPVPAPVPGISLIIPTRDRPDLLSVCIDSIRRLTTYPAYEIIVIDNQSREPETLRYFETGQAAGTFRVFRYDAPFNFSAMNNEAARVARSAILGFINNDVELITPDWLEQVAGALARPEVGAVGAKLRFSNDMIQHAGVILGIGGPAENAFQHLNQGDEGYFNRTNVAGNYSAVTAACLFTRADSYAAAGGFDAANLPVAFNDVDLCLRLREHGHLIVWTPHIELYHHESVSRGADLSAERRARAFKEEAYMRQRWRGTLLSDPYYNPNLNLDGRPFTGLAFPSRHRWGDEG